MADVPQIGARVPGIAVRIALGALCLLLVAVELPGAFWITIGVLLALLAAVVPRSHAAWLVILLLGLSDALRGSGTQEWRVLLLVAGLHAVAILGSLALAIPAGAAVQLRVFGRPVLRYAIIQTAAQAVAVLVFALAAPQAGARALTFPALAIVAGCGFAALVGLLAVPLLRGDSHR